MIKTELSYTVSNNSRSFLYFDGWLGIVDAWFEYRIFKRLPLYKDIKFKVIWNWYQKKT